MQVNIGSLSPPSKLHDKERDISKPFLATHL